jgi:hypothetical protein
MEFYKKVGYLTLCATVAFLALTFITTAHAVSNYSVTSNFHGTDTPLGADVTVTATTNDATVYQVTFLWKDASKTVRFTDVVAVSGGIATSTHQPNSLGDWGVQALFQGPDGTTKEGIEEVVAIRATSFNVIPEIPLLGTAGISLAMVLGLAYKTKKKPTK